MDDWRLDEDLIQRMRSSEDLSNLTPESVVEVWRGPSGEIGVVVWLRTVVRFPLFLRREIMWTGIQACHSGAGGDEKAFSDLLRWYRNRDEFDTAQPAAGVRFYRTVFLSLARFDAELKRSMESGEMKEVNSVILRGDNDRLSAAYRYVCRLGFEWSDHCDGYVKKFTPRIAQ